MHNLQNVNVQIPLQRFGEASDIAQAALFLVASTLLASDAVVVMR